MNQPIRLAVFLSGGGTTLQNLLDRAADGRLPAQVVQVVSSNPESLRLGPRRTRRRPGGRRGAQGLPLAGGVQSPPLRAVPRRRHRPHLSGRLLAAVDGPRRLPRPHPEHSSIADPGVLRQGISRYARPRGGARRGGQGERLHRAFRGRRVRPRADRGPARRAGPGGRYARNGSPSGCLCRNARCIPKRSACSPRAGYASKGDGCASCDAKVSRDPKRSARS